ncbi:hypothetical protein B0H67DRAFT_572907 [Lasiosphaeris hirsuta]|uniref:Uncharacterized protein n=1 Tax=Lasiosphaeris hirsuta TaxID=260670 RepID=A0AA40ANX6_9PEZI|nr:hypothetical protein B0H67DRAFT_572907 [Lasiosphaeris hirsuta]
MLPLLHPTEPQSPQPPPPRHTSRRHHGTANTSPRQHQKPSSQPHIHVHALRQVSLKPPQRRSEHNTHQQPMHNSEDRISSRRPKQPHAHPIPIMSLQPLHILLRSLRQRTESPQVQERQTLTAHPPLPPPNSPLGHRQQTHHDHGANVQHERQPRQRHSEAKQAIAEDRCPEGVGALESPFRRVVVRFETLVFCRGDIWQSAGCAGEGLDEGEWVEGGRRAAREDSAGY